MTVEDLPGAYEHVNTVLAFPESVYDVAGVDLDELSEALSAVPGLAEVESVDEYAFVLDTELALEDVRAEALAVVARLNAAHERESPGPDS